MFDAYVNYFNHEAKKLSNKEYEHATPYVELPDGTEQPCIIIRQSPDYNNVLVRLNKETELLTETQFIKFKPY